MSICVLVGFSEYPPIFLSILIYSHTEKCLSRPSYLKNMKSQKEMEKVSVFCNNRNKYLKLTSLFVINSMRDTQHIDRYEDLRLRHSMYVRLYSLTKCRKVSQTSLICLIFFLDVCEGAATMAWPSLLTSLFFWTAQPRLCPVEPINSAANESQHDIVWIVNMKHQKWDGSDTVLSKRHHRAGMMKSVSFLRYISHYFKLQGSVRGLTVCALMIQHRYPCYSWKVHCLQIDSL